MANGLLGILTNVASNMAQMSAPTDPYAIQAAEASKINAQEAAGQQASRINATKLDVTNKANRWAGLSDEALAKDETFKENSYFGGDVGAFRTYYGKLTTRINDKGPGGRAVSVSDINAVL